MSPLPPPLPNSKAYNAWKSFAEDAKDASNKLNSGLRKLANMDLTCGFIRIRAAQELRVKLKELEAKALEHSSPRKIMRRIVDFWSGRGAIRRGGMRIAQKIMNQGMAKAWSQWAEIAEKAAAARRTALRIANNGIYKMFLSWKTVAEEAASAMEALQKVAAIWGNKALSACYRSWKELLEEANATKSAQMRVISRLVNRKLSACWGTWHAQWEDHCALRTAFSSIRNVALKWSLVQWMQTAFEARDQLRAMKQAVGKLFNQRLSAGFTKWQEHALEGAEKAERVQDKFKEAAKRLIYQKLAAALYQWGNLASAAKDAARILDLAADGMIPGKAAFTHWKEIAVEGARVRRALMTAASKFAGNTPRGRWIAWRDFHEVRKAKLAGVKKVVAMLAGRDKAKMERALGKLSENATKRLKMGKMFKRMLNLAMSNGWRTWLIDYSFAKAGKLIKNSAMQTNVGKAFTRFVEAYKAALSRYQHGKFAAAKQHCQSISFTACVIRWHRKAEARIIMTEANKKATKHLRVLTFHRLHRYCWRSAEREEFAITSDSHARRKGLKRVFKRYARLNAPGGDLQLRSVATACAMAYGSRKGFMRWQQHTFMKLCYQCAAQHERIRHLRISMGLWMGFIQQKQAEKQKQWRVIQSKVDLRLLAKVVIAWRDCTRLKLISLPSHLYALAGTWGAGAAYWRLVELREAERHAAHAAAHHQRVHAELLRASSASSELGIAQSAQALTNYLPPAAMAPYAVPPGPAGSSSASMARYLASYSGAGGGAVAPFMPPLTPGGPPPEAAPPPPPPAHYPGAEMMSLSDRAASLSRLRERAEMRELAQRQADQRAADEYSASTARHALSRTLAEYGYGSQYSAAPMPYPYGPGGMAGGYDPLAGLPPRSLFTPGVTPSAPRSRPSSAPPGGEGAEDAWGGLVDSMSSAVGEIA